MTLTVLDSAVALIVVDLQRGIVARPAAHPVTDVVDNARRLADAFRARGLPVVLVNTDRVPGGRTEVPSNVAGLPAGWTELVPELGAQTGDHRVTKGSWSAFTGTGLDGYLSDHGMTQVVVAGIATSIGVEATARQARELGLNVTLAIDAMTDASAEAHTNSVARIFPRLGETGTTSGIIALLDHRDASA